jgi:hypothetical protein
VNDLEKFHCRLALELHLPLVAVLNLPAWEIRRWQEYFSENLFTKDREEFYLAQIAYILYNSNSEEKAELSDFIWKPKPVRDDPDVLNEKLEALRGLIGGKTV